MRYLLRCALCLGCLWGLAGCAPVAPWARGTLAKPQMAIDPYPLQSALHAHVHGSREAAGSAGTSDGGGCGCY